MPRVEVGDVTLEVLDEGSGPPLLLVHGFPLDHTMWDAQITAFATRYRVIAPDLRGYGGSDVTIGTVTMSRFADDLARLLDALGVRESVVYCGLSMGGYVGWEFVRDHGRRLRGLIVCDSRAAADSAEARANREKMVDSVLRSGPEPAVEAMIGKLFGDETRHRRPDVVESTRQVMLRTDPQGIAAGLRGMAARPDSYDLLPRIDVPVLLVCGAEDAITPASEMRGLADSIPRVSFEEIAASGHMAPLEKSSEVNAAISAFLEGLD